MKNLVMENKMRVTGQFSGMVLMMWDNRLQQVSIFKTVSTDHKESRKMILVK
ncbi:hypothetical protein Ct9H90mP29_16420 [bacterium]|nr:MAG: hypothetical protein Ct9H90mP29_16420 [bacterium]